MRILWDCRSIAPNMGGIGHAAAAWLRELLRQKPLRWSLVPMFSSMCPQQFIFETVPELKETGSVQIVEAGMIAQNFEQLQLPTILEQNLIDLYFNPCFTIPAVKSSRLQCSVVHDVVFFDNPEWVEPGLQKYLKHGTDLALRRADIVFTVSDYSRSRIQALSASRKWDRAHTVSLLRPSISESFRSMAANVDMRKGDRPFLLYLGAVEQKKGICVLLNAYAILRKRLGARCPGLTLVGGVGGQPFDLARELERLQLTGMVEHHGRVSEARKIELLRTAEIFLFPSLYEGFGIPPLEAMAVGTPVVAARSTSLPEVLGDAAAFANPGDPEDFVSVIESVLFDKLRRQTLVKKGKLQATRIEASNEVQTLISNFERLEKSA
jgi:glycosyltransferase involved in cell wall biosynthesis